MREAIPQQDKEHFYEQLHARARKVDPYRYGKRPSFLRNNWGLILASAIVLTAVVVQIVDAVKEHK